MVIASHTRSMSKTTGNRHHNLVWHLKTTWNKQNMTLLQYRSVISRTTFSAKEREAPTTLRANTKVNSKKSDKGNTTIVMDTQSNITCKLSSERTVFWDTEVFKGPRFAWNKIFDVQTHVKATATFQYTQFSSCHSVTVKEAFIKGQTLRLLPTNSIKEKFESSRRDFKFRLLERSWPMSFQRHTTVCHRQAYNPGVPKLDEILTNIHVSIQMPPLSVTGRIKSLQEGQITQIRFGQS